jgi:hypothetical protein
MANAQLELPCQLDAESVRALALGINAIRSPRVGRTIHEPVVSSDRSRQAPPRSSCCGGPMARADARERPVRKLCRRSAPYLFRIYWPHAIERIEDPYAFGLLLGDVRPFLIQRRSAFRVGQVSWRAKFDRRRRIFFLCECERFIYSGICCRVISAVAIVENEPVSAHNKEAAWPLARASLSAWSISASAASG